ncbi:MAG: Long-chain-fatty-acid CoA ligase (AMP-forming), partial [Firmicutes bacterium]|nr:Long-chain-fatty-acid CoA ligase (AMP-forming) [Bacillota bacterium]
SGLEAVICLEKGFSGNGNDLLSLDDIINTGHEFAKEDPEIFENTWKSVNGSDGATIIYTSGTTGELKGVFYDQFTWIEGLAQSVEHMNNGGYEINSDDSTLAVMPLTHVWERENSSLGIVAAGGLVGFAESPKTVLADITEVRPTWILLVPRLWSRILTGLERTFGATEEGKKVFDWALDVGLKSVDYYTDDRGGLNLLPLLDGTWPDGLPEQLAAEWRKADELVYSKVRAMFGGRLSVPWSGGARMPVDLHRKWVALTIPLMTGWGLSETTAGMAHDNHARIKFGYVNRVLPGASVQVQSDGELWAKGRGVASEYFNDPKNTSTTFENGWFKTGDIGEKDDEGYVRITDRKKMIIVLDTGKKVAPARIEEIICRSLLIDQLIVTGDDKKFISALIVPTFDNLITMLESQGVIIDKTNFIYETINGIPMCTQVSQEFIDMPVIRQAIDMEIKKANQQLDDFETIKNYHILNKRFSEEEGEVTPTQKVKTNFVLKKYADVIEEMYK